MINIMNLKSMDKNQLYKELNSRNTLDFAKFNKPVREILDAVFNKGDEALFEYTERFDGINLKEKGLTVASSEMQEAYGQISKDYLQALRAAVQNIREFHAKQKQNSWIVTEKKGVMLGQKVTPIERVGVYVPGGTAAYPSSVLMNVIPAQAAGVEKIVMVTPPDREGNINPGVLVAAAEIGVEEIYRIGGAQAVGALAYGTQTVPKVHKIVGPGNIYVAAAKRLVYGYVDIDMIAGPSEILVIADESANPGFVAADLLSQAEHDEMASSILITTSEKLAEEVKDELIRQAAMLDRKEIIEESLRNYGVVIITDTLEEAVEICNEIAPEHLELCVDKPFELLNDIKNAGAIFLGHYAPESLGDYFAGPNHVLPTSGTARFYSPLSVDDFVKKSSIIYYDYNSLKKVKDQIMTLAEQEGLTSHKNAIKIRFE